MKSILIAVLTLVYAVRASPTDQKPNFLLLFMDDLGYGDLGFTGHPTTQTPNLDRLAWNGKILTTWYSGCNVCTGSRAALMTGRQFPRTGLPGVLGPTTPGGLNLNETTLAEHLQDHGYTTAAVGKWHLGQRQVYLPGNRGFDYYLGIPYSDDMGNAMPQSCPVDSEEMTESLAYHLWEESDGTSPWFREQYEALGLLNAKFSNVKESSAPEADDDDPARTHLPLVYQEFNETRVLEQPLDFTTLAYKYNDFALNFLDTHKNEPFFLYMPFSHVHTTSATQPDRQYSTCSRKGKSPRGPFGDALAEADWIIGNVMEKLRNLGLEENTLVLFTSDNGPWLHQQLSGGSMGLFTGRSAGYWNTGKGSNWEGGIREPAFAYWKGMIEPFSRSSEIISSMDVFPTLSKLAGAELPSDRVFDGRDMSNILLYPNGKSKHDFLFFYGTCNDDSYWSVSAVRHGSYKVHWCTGPGMIQDCMNCTRQYDPPLMFNVDQDPSEANPLNEPNQLPTNEADLAAMNRMLAAYAMEKATFEFGTILPIPDGPGEGPQQYGVCCDRSRGCNCTNVSDEEEDPLSIGIFNLGTRKHHDRYHSILGVDEPSPARTQAQKILQQEASAEKHLRQ
eukprot:Nitzschia sp. Nitz4//scaffold42_size132992//46093//47946//NITZ4_003391-RA/size132992-processed-gene-0.8-mRNA-1//1//CDS//3329551694//3443//frame0